LGIKPLYYWPTERGLSFASELRSFLCLPDFPRALSRAALAQYLAFGYVPDPACIFPAAKKLPPGHALSWSRTDGTQVRQYWSAAKVEQRQRSEADATEELRTLLDDAVRSHLESEVPLGAFLSGGVDSSTVVALMARAMDSQPRTFSIGFGHASYDESGDAEVVARELGTRHTSLVLNPDADALVGEVAAAFDEPFGDDSALPTFVVAQLARRHVTVALSGDGGDELFGGYTRYTDAARQWVIPSAGLRRLIRAVAMTLPHVAPGRNRLLDIARSRRGRYTTTVCSALRPSEGGVASALLHEADGNMDRFLDVWFDAVSDRDFLTQITLVDIASYLPGDILTKVDRTTMATSLEARVPLLDHALVEFAVSLPISFKLRDGKGKWLLRRAIEGLVPTSTLAKRKQGFALPLEHWFRRELRHRLDGLSSERSLIAEYVDPIAVKRQVREHLMHRRDHGTVLWRLLMLERWLGALSAGTLSRPNEPSSVLNSVVDTAVALA
jgi:asparagine synthase (glutamine-hydrolysing)